MLLLVSWLGIALMGSPIVNYEYRYIVRMKQVEVFLSRDHAPLFYAIQE